ncbi:MAG TPA: ABC transporter ATP-binding protein [Candidatus Caldiarchaeum subterraneum]|uniref:Probable branched-chain amino acid transport ATP-binding protein LivG n=1 Tax=Caldiarchaeum subterraneum TaxID=311458 RepID=A0A833EA91_CALS0|nr:ABC transporter ATP-binding protein [Candidatus Caldarchaeum subterraneum]
MAVILEARDIHLRFGGVIALKGVDIEIHEGELLALVGPNGSGKTSLLNCICGFYKPQEGRIRFKGHDITKLPPHRRASMGIGRTFQTPYIFHGTVLDNIMVGYMTRNPILKSISYRGLEEAREKVEKLIDFVELEPYRDEHVEGLPMGIRKKIELARILMWDPEVILLDEPSSGLSIDEKRDMARYIIELNEVLGKTIVLVEHDMSLVHDLADKTVVLDAGVKIAEGKPEKVVKEAIVIKAYIGE